MRPSSVALILLAILTIVSWCLVIFKATKKRVVNNIPPIAEEKIERPLLATKDKEERTNALKKEVDNISQYPWVVEVYASLRYDDAKNLASSLKDQGFPAYISWINLKGRKWYRVRVGTYSTKEEAQRMRERIVKDFGITESWVHLLRTQTPRKIFE